MYIRFARADGCFYLGDCAAARYCRDPEWFAAYSQKLSFLTSDCYAAFPATTVGQASAFRARAALVGKGIQSTSQKLHQLTQLAKRTSMFDDPAQEINELTMVLKQDIQGLNIQIADLQNMHGAALDGNKQSANHTHTVVDNLRLRLKDTTKEFQEALTIRNDNLKSQTDRRNLFSAQPRARAGQLCVRFLFDTSVAIYCSTSLSFAFLHR